MTKCDEYGKRGCDEDLAPGIQPVNYRITPDECHATHGPELSLTILICESLVSRDGLSSRRQLLSPLQPLQGSSLECGRVQLLRPLP